MIFFRTVFAQDHIPTPSADFIYEEPDPPQHLDTISAGDIQGAIRELPRVAIIIDDMGHDRNLGEEMIEVPVTVTYSFLPFAPYTTSLAEKAFWAGKDILLHLPLQPQSLVVDPGPGAIYVSDLPEIQREKFSRALMAVPHAIGVNNHMGSKFTLDENAMTTLLREIAAKQLFFIDSVTASHSMAHDIAARLKVKSAKRQVFLDNDQQTVQICRQLERLVHIAESHGIAIGIAHPHKVTAEALRTCAGQYAGRVQYVAAHTLFESL